jgi:hypothetical protein
MAATLDVFVMSLCPEMVLLTTSTEKDQWLVAKHILESSRHSVFAPQMDIQQ